MKKELKKWVRNCPNCKTEKIYKSKQGWQVANDKTTLCIVCSRLGEKNPFFGKTHSNEVATACGDRFRGNIKTEEHIQKWRESVKSNQSLSGERNGMYGRVGKLNPFFGKTHTKHTLNIISIKVGKALKGRVKTDNHKKQMRVSAIDRIENRVGQMMPNYNPNSISIIEQKANELGILDLQHAENGGEYHIKELGYWVDGYSKDKNIVIEYYESTHKYQIEKDLKRQNEITKFLNCEFIIITEVGR